MKFPEPDPVTNWSAEPLVLSIERVCEIYGVKPQGLRRRVAQGRFTPPVMTHPMRWNRFDLERAWMGQSQQKRRTA